MGSMCSRLPSIEFDRGYREVQPLFSTLSVRLMPIPGRNFWRLDYPKLAFSIVAILGQQTFNTRTLA